MDWTDCPVIEVVPGKMSGAPVLRHSRVRPQDLLANIEEGPEWIAEAFRLPIGDVREVLAFHDRHHDELPLEYVSPERISQMGADIDWTACRLIEPRSGDPVIRGTLVRPEYLVVHRSEGEAALAETYGLPLATVKAILAFFDRRTSQLASAV